jgi:parvulin-like peptidyl-prolyl isomerase
MNLISKLLVLSFSTVMLTACLEKSDTKSNALNDIGDFTITQQEIDAQSQAASGGTPQAAKQRQQRLLQTYIERNALAEAISQQPDFKALNVSAELKRMRNEYIINKYLDSFEASAASEEAVSNYYTANKDKYSIRKANIAHIYFRARDKSKQEKLDAQKQQAEKVYEELTSGKSFEDLVQQYSEDPISKKENGVLGWVSSNEPNGDLILAVADLKPGDASKVFETDRGFHIVKLLEDIQIEEIPLEQVKDKIAYQLKYQAKLDKLNELKKLAAPKTNKDLARFKVVE